jgi:hypothetical protein
MYCCTDNDYEAHMPDYILGCLFIICMYAALAYTWFALNDPHEISLDKDMPMSQPRTKEYSLSQAKLLRLLKLPADTEIVCIVPNHTFRRGMVLRDRRVVVVVNAPANPRRSFFARFWRSA